MFVTIKDLYAWNEHFQVLFKKKILLSLQKLYTLGMNTFMFYSIKNTLQEYYTKFINLLSFFNRKATILFEVMNCFGYKHKQ